MTCMLLRHSIPARCATSKPNAPHSCPGRSIDDARKARQAGADSILIKWELVQQHAGDPGRLALLLEELRYATSGDD